MVFPHKRLSVSATYRQYRRNGLYDVMEERQTAVVLQEPSCLGQGAIFF